MYWPKFTGKAETKRNCPNLKNQSWFSESYGPTSYHGSHGSLLFSHRAVLETKMTAKLRGSRFFRLDCTVWFEFQNYETKIINLNGFDYSKKKKKNLNSLGRFPLQSKAQMIVQRLTIQACEGEDT